MPYNPNIMFAPAEYEKKRAEAHDFIFGTRRFTFFVTWNLVGLFLLIVVSVSFYQVPPQGMFLAPFTLTHITNDPVLYVGFVSLYDVVRNYTRVEHACSVLANDTTHVYYSWKKNMCLPAQDFYRIPNLIIFIAVIWALGFLCMLLIFARNIRTIDSLRDKLKILRRFHNKEDASVDDVNERRDSKHSACVLSAFFLFILLLMFMVKTTSHWLPPNHTMETLHIDDAVIYQLPKQVIWARVYGRLKIGAANVTCSYDDTIHDRSRPLRYPFDFNLVSVWQADYSCSRFHRVPVPWHPAWCYLWLLMILGFIVSIIYLCRLSFVSQVSQPYYL